MKWITRERVKVDRVACPWLIKKFIDPDATFLFVPSTEVMAIAERENAIPYDVKDVELGHHGKECSFDAVVKKYELDRDPAMVLLAKIVNGADTDNALWNQPEAAGLNAVAEGFRHLGFKDDHAINAALLLSYASLKGGDRVGLFGFDARVRLRSEPLGGVDRFPRLRIVLSEYDASWLPLLAYRLERIESFSR